METRGSNSSEAYLRSLIFSVCRLCDRTKDLATSRDPLAALPMREALDAVRAALDSVHETWLVEVPAPFPADAEDAVDTEDADAELAPVETWLLDDEGFADGDDLVL